MRRWCHVVGHLALSRFDQITKEFIGRMHASKGDMRGDMRGVKLRKRQTCLLLDYSPTCHLRLAIRFLLLHIRHSLLSTRLLTTRLPATRYCSLLLATTHYTHCLLLATTRYALLTDGYSDLAAGE